MPMLWWSLRKLRHWNFHTRAEAIEELSRSQDGRAVDALASVLVDKDLRVSTRAAAALLKIGDPRSLRFLADSKDPSQRRKAVVALAARGDRGGIDALTQMLLEASGAGVYEAIQAVIDAEINCPDVTNALADVLKAHCNDANISLSCKAVEALGKIGDRRAQVIEALAHAVLSPQDVRRTAENTLRQLGTANQIEWALRERARIDAQHQTEARDRHLKHLATITGSQIILRAIDRALNIGTAYELPAATIEDLSLANEKFSGSDAPAEAMKVCDYLLKLRGRSGATSWDRIFPRLPNAVKSALRTNLEDAVIVGIADWVYDHDRVVTVSTSKEWLKYLQWTPQEEFYRRNRAYQIRQLRAAWSAQCEGLCRLLAELPTVPTDDAIRYLGRVGREKMPEVYPYCLERLYKQKSSEMSDASILRMNSCEDVIFYIFKRKYVYYGTDLSNLAQKAVIDKASGEVGGANARLMVPYRWEVGEWVSDGHNDTWVIHAKHVTWFVTIRVGRAEYLCGSDFKNPAEPTYVLRQVQA